MNRSQGIDRLSNEDAPWDVVVIGGGATGLGSALDAVSRGYRTLLLEAADFANGTSSRSTKLMHGGVRYLRQGNVSLVRESLHEREWLLSHVPHQVRPQPFLIPTFSCWETWYYRIGLWFYDRLAGKLGIRSTQRFSKQDVLNRIPSMNGDKLAGGVMYWDSQFDDARLCVQAAQTIWDHGGIALNHFKVTNLLKTDGRLTALQATDVISGESFSIRGRSFILATGIFSDSLRQQDVSGNPSIIQTSRGSHVVVDESFLPGGTALMIPKTSDGRLLFMVPWLNKVIIGTTDIPDDNICLEPRISSEEINFILKTAAPYLSKPIQRSDIRSVYSGLRPLVRPSGRNGKTSSISRDHFIDVSESGLVTVAGGKWTTFRKMGEDAVDKAIETGGLDRKPSASRSMRFHGFPETEPEADSPLKFYGSDAARIIALIRDQPELGEHIHPNLSYTWAEVLWSIREELAESVEDVLARRTRALFLDARAAMKVAPQIGQFIAKERNFDDHWAADSVESFIAVARNYYRQS